MAAYVIIINNHGSFWTRGLCFNLALGPENLSDGLCEFQRSMIDAKNSWEPEENPGKLLTAKSSGSHAQVTQQGALLPPSGHLAMSGTLFGWLGKVLFCLLFNLANVQTVPRLRTSLHQTPTVAQLITLPPSLLVAYHVTTRPLVSKTVPPWPWETVSSLRVKQNKPSLFKQNKNIQEIQPEHIQK